MKPLVTTNLPARRARIAFAIVTAAVLANFAFNRIQASRGYGFPQNDFLFDPVDRFADFFKLAFSYPGAPLHPVDPVWGLNEHFAKFIAVIERFRGTVLNHFHVPPLPTLIALTVRHLMVWVDPVVLFIGVVAIVLSALYRVVARRGGPLLGLAGVVSYPSLFMIDRGHLFSAITAACLIAAVLRLDEPERSRWPTLLLFAIAMNIRPNVAIIPGALWLVRKMTFGEIVLLGTLSLALLAGSLLVDHAVYPAYSLASFIQGLDNYRTAYLMIGLGATYTTSLYAALVTLFSVQPWVFVAPLMVGAVLACATIIAAWRGRLSTAALLFLLIAIYALASQVFADYHLLAFLLPLVAVVRVPGPLGGDERAMFATLLLVLVPKNYIFLPTDGPLDASLQVLLNPLALLVTAIFVLLTAFRRSAVEVNEESSVPATMHAAVPR